MKEIHIFNFGDVLFSGIQYISPYFILKGGLLLLATYLSVSCRHVLKTFNFRKVFLNFVNNLT